MPAKKKSNLGDLGMIEKSMQMAANRMVRLFDLDAPDIIKFNEFKLLEARFEEWCMLKGFDHKRAWMDQHIDPEKMN